MPCAPQLVLLPTSAQKCCCHPAKTVRRFSQKTVQLFSLKNPCPTEAHGRSDFAAEGFSGKPFQMPGWWAEPREVSVLLFPNPAGAAVTTGRCIGTLIKTGPQGDVLEHEQNREAEECCLCWCWTSPLLQYDLSLFVCLPLTLYRWRAFGLKKTKTTKHTHQNLKGIIIVLNVHFCLTASCQNLCITPAVLGTILT